MKKLENLLYSNVGKKIKTLALIIGIIGMLAVVVGLFLYYLTASAFYYNLIAFKLSHTTP